MNWVLVLLLVHIGGAIIGIGPTFAFGVLGSLASKTSGVGSSALTQAIFDIQKKLVNPVVLFTQPASGAALIFLTRRNEDFFQREWLWISVALYAVILVIAYVADAPVGRQILDHLKTGSVQTPEFGLLIKRTSINGMIMGVLVIVIIVLMIFKPGDIAGHMH